MRLFVVFSYYDKNAVSGILKTVRSPFTPDLAYLFVFSIAKVVKYDTLCGFLFIGWSLHYLPFFLMARQLFLHHYFPALYFAILLYCAIFDLVTSTLRPKVRLQVAGVLIILAIWNFQHFAPLAYGTEWTRPKCEGARWLKSWDFSCGDFHHDVIRFLFFFLSPVTVLIESFLFLLHSILSIRHHCRHSRKMLELVFRLLLLCQRLAMEALLL